MAAPNPPPRLNYTYVTEGARRKSRVLVHDQYKYLKNKTVKNAVYWRCHRETCQVTMSTALYDTSAALPNPNVFVKNPPVPHCHPPDTTLINKEEFRSSALEMIAQDTARPMLGAFEAASRNLAQGGGDVTSLPKFDQLSRSMARVRTELTPKHPRTLDEVYMPHPYTHTYSGENFCLEINQVGDEGLLLFATDQDLDNLGLCHEFYMDATHSSCPKPYKQYFTVHGNYRGQVILMASVLMTGKHELY